jgi:uncharacterized UPF0160 family protein
MSIFSKKKILVTHNGTFHTDDLFATAILYILNKGNVKIIRTRDPEKIKKGDYVYDVGGEYDPSRNRFDHHQRFGAGQRENGIPYAAFGLVWKEFGEKICGSHEVANRIDRNLVSAIDALDNGVNIANPTFEGVMLLGIDRMFLNQIPTWKENHKNIDVIFKTQTKEVAKFIKRHIEVVKAEVEGSNTILDVYKNSQDKRIIIMDSNFPRYLFQNTLSSLPEPVYLIYPSFNKETWKVEAIRKNPTLMDSRKLLPEDWRLGVNHDPKLAEITGVPDVIFCHRSGFLIEVKSKEGAIALAQKAFMA